MQARRYYPLPEPPLLVPYHKKIIDDIYLPLDFSYGRAGLFLSPWGTWVKVLGRLYVFSNALTSSPKYSRSM